jgi:AraC-like DNA-binding protein
VDPLSDVLSLLKPRSYLSAGFDAGGDWSIQFPANAGIKCYAVMSGQCWLAVEGVAEPMCLRTGDCFLLPGGRPFRLASDLALTPADAADVFAAARLGGVARWNGGGDFFLVGSRFTLSGQHADILLRMLPPVVHIHDKLGQEALRWSVERMMRELREQQPGNFLVAEHLAHLMLLQALRLHMAQGLEGGVGWLFALRDQQMGAAINAMHEDPAHGWTLKELAGRAAMSRSAFALKFKQTVGIAPIDYLTQWRMLLAGERLTNSRDPIARVALSLGYESESAFSTAFKRVLGSSPRRYARPQTGAS